MCLTTVLDRLVNVEKAKKTSNFNFKFMAVSVCFGEGKKCIEFVRESLKYFFGGKGSELY